MPYILICLNCKKRFVRKKVGQEYCSQKCGAGYRSWQRKERKQSNKKLPQFSKIIESVVFGPELEAQIIVDRIVPLVRQTDSKLWEQLVLFVSILRSRGYEIINTKSKSLKDLIDISQNETKNILKDVL